MQAIPIDQLPADVQATIRAAIEAGEQLVIIDGGRLTATITRYAQPEPNRGIQIGHGNNQINSW